MRRRRYLCRQMRNSASEKGGSATLSQRLRIETKALHTAAERAGVMRSLARGELPLRRYAMLLENLASIYRALEYELDRHQEHPAIRWIPRDALRRHGAIQLDLAALNVSQLRATVPAAATREYVERLHRAGDNAPVLLLAHAYVRYLGDLSGGQILAPIIGRSFGGADRQVTHFYEFPFIDDVDAFRLSFREGLDRIVEAAAADEVVEEAKIAFRLHERLFRELEQPPR